MSYKVFHFPGEGHTLGYFVSSVLQNDPQIEHSSYKVPHPLEEMLEISVLTTTKSISAQSKMTDALVSVEKILSDFISQLPPEYEI